MQLVQDGTRVADAAHAAEAARVEAQRPQPVQQPGALQQKLGGLAARSQHALHPRLGLEAGVGSLLRNEARGQHHRGVGSRRAAGHRRDGQRAVGQLARFAVEIDRHVLGQVEAALVAHGAEALLRLGQRDAVVRARRAGQRALHGAQVELDHLGVGARGRVRVVPEALRLGVGFHERHLLLAAAGQTQAGTTAMIVTGGHSVKSSGTYDKVCGLLEEAGLTTVLFDKVTPNPLTTTVEEGARLAKDRQVDVVIGLGGGSTMDAAKGIAFMAENEGGVSEYIYGERTSDKALPLILVPTTFGTGSEANGFAVMTNPDNGDKKSLRSPALVATASIVDPDLMRTMPSSVIAANGCDMLCHCIEAFTANNAQPFTDALALYAIPLIANNIVSLYRGEGTDEQWAKVCLAGTIGGMVINTAGITLAHAMEHPVSGLRNVTHGKGLAAIEPTAIEATYQYNRFKYGRIARILGGFTAEDCAPRVKRLLADLDLNVTLRDLGIEKKDIPWLAQNAQKVSPGNLVNTPGSQLVTTEESLEKLYESML